MFELWEVLRMQIDQSSHKPISIHELYTEDVLNPQDTIPIIPTLSARNTILSRIQRFVLAHKLSPSTIAYIASSYSWFAGTPTSPASITKLTREFLSRRDLDMNERLLAVALQSYLSFVEGMERSQNDAATEYSVRFLAPALLAKDFRIDSDVLLWSVLMIGATGKRGSGAQKWVDIMLGAISAEYCAEKWQELERRFMPFPGVL